MAETRLQRLAKNLDGPVSVAALLVIPALLMEDRADAPRLQALALAINWAVWLVFCFEFTIECLAFPAWKTVRRSWLNLTLIILSPPFFPQYFQAARSLRVFRLARLLRLGFVAAISLRLARQFFGPRKFHYVMLVGAVIVLFGALGVYLIEGDVNPSVSSFGNAVWWSIVTATTVGYGDVSPTTPEGRVIAVILMITGIGVIGVFTATIASLFFDQGQEEQATDVSTRLDAIERKLDELLAQTSNNRDRSSL